MHRTVICACAVIALAGPAAFAEDAILPFTRAMYGPWNASQLASAGFDARYRQADWEWGREWIAGTFERESVEAASSGLVFIAGQYYDSADVDFHYTRAMNRYGEEEPRTTSPTDETYWLRHIEEAAVFIANLSLHCPIWGIVWDMEPYRSTSRWPTGSYTYDQDSMLRFANETGRVFPELDPDQRYPYLARMGLVEEYCKWQGEKVFEMARRTAIRVHSINPDLSLGTLWHQDDWLIWSVLSGFNDSFAPVTSWYEETYPGYDRDLMRSQKEKWSSLRLHGSLIAGLFTVWVSPFDMIVNMEEALRWDGVVWVYQYDRNPYRLADEEAYRTAYRLLDSHILFDLRTPNPLPAFDIYPGGEARPYLGPGSVSVLLPYHLRFVLDADVELIVDSSEIWYVGRNLTLRRLASTNIATTDLPCLLIGLTEDDIIRTEVWALLRELRHLTSIYADLGLGELGPTKASLMEAENLYEAGRHVESRSVLVSARQDAYRAVLSTVVPLYEQAKTSPRNSTIPLSALNSIGAAQVGFSTGDLVEGRSYLFKGFQEWKKAVSDRAGTSACSSISWILLLLLLRGTCDGILGAPGSPRQRGCLPEESVLR